MADTKTERGSFSRDMGVLLESGEGADVVLVVGDSELPAHSVILAARSPVFATMLRSDMRESRSRRIEITDMREAVVRQLLSFVYSDETAQLESMATELLAAADKYDLPLLKQRCEQQLVRDLSVENAADTAGLAELHRCPELTRAAVRFIAAHPEVLATDGWGRLMQENVEAAKEISRQLAALVQPRPAPPPVKEQPRNRVLTEEQKQALSQKLIAAVSKGQTGEVWALLEAGAPVDGKDSSGDTALHYAAENGRADIVRFLIDAGADVNTRGYGGWTPLHGAAWCNHERIVWMLIAASANVDVQDNGGDTPLHMAASRGHSSATQALLLAGARRDLDNNSGKTPAEVAHRDTIALFST